MAKEKRSVEELDAELAALEAELAALEGRAPPPRKAPAKPAPEPAKAAPEAREEEAPAEAAPKKKFALPKAKLPKAKLNLPFGKKKGGDAEPEPAAEALVDPEVAAPPAVAQAPAVALVDEAPPAPPEVIPVTDGSQWRREDGAWVRANPDVPVPVVRRVLDENGEVVREEAAAPEDLDEATGRKAERGLGKLLGGRPLKMPSLPKFGRKGP